MLRLCFIHSAWKYPNIQGLDTLKGKLMHSASWDNGYNLRGKAVAVIGGGSSAVQIIPSLQPGNFPIHQELKYLNHDMIC